MNFAQKAVTARGLSTPTIGFYEWYSDGDNDTWTYREKILSPNFHPPGYDTEWRLCVTKNSQNSNIVALSFLTIKKIDVCIDFEFFVLGQTFFFTLDAESVLSDHVIGHFKYNDLFPTDSEERKCVVSVKWSETGFPPSQTFPFVLVQDLGSLLDSGKFSDVVVETEDGSRISAHRNILSSRSPVFCAMLESGMLEAESRCIRIDDFSAKSVKDMVAFMYTGHTPQSNYDSDIELLKLAEKYQLMDLKKACGRSLSLQLLNTNAAELLLLADGYQENFLKQKVLDFIAENPFLFTESELFENLEPAPKILVEIITRLVQKLLR